MSKIINLFLCLLVASAIHAQTTVVSGIVADTSEKKPLANAIVSLLSKDSVLIRFTRTDQSGRFQLQANKPGPLLVMVSYPKFADFIDEVPNSGANVDLGKINLIKKSVLLEEVIVSQKIGAIRMKGDTLEFRADSFAVRQGANVEELLKKLPGLQVNKKGEITAQGEKVQKVLVDGEEFFSDDPAVVTQNLRADAIDKVQVFDKKSDQAAFTGIDDGEKQKTINLQLKEDRKKGYFGKAKLGGGLPNFFENDAMINVFKGKRKIAAYGTMSNTGKAGLSWQDNNKFGGGDNFEFNEDEGYFFSYNEGDEFNTWGGRFNGEGLPKAWTAGAHFSNKWSADKKNINGNYQYYKQDIFNEGTTTTQSIGKDEVFYSNQQQKSNTQNARHQLSGFYDLKLDSLSSLKFTVKGSLTNAENESYFQSNSINDLGEKINDAERRLFSKGEKQQSSISGIWRKKFAKKGRTISINFEHQYNNNLVDGIIRSLNNYYESGAILRRDTTDQVKDNYSQNNALNTKISYTEPLSKKWFIELNYGYRYNNSKALRSSFNKDDQGKYESLDPRYSSDYAFDFNTHSGGLNFRFNGDKITASFGSNITNANYVQTDLIKDTSIRYNFVNLFPKASIRFKMGAQTGLRFAYNGSTRQPSLQQIQPIAENTDPLNVQVGNPNLKQEFRHNFSAFFNDYKVMTSRNIYLNIGANLIENAISGNDSVNYTTGQRIYQFVNVNGNIDYYLYTGYWFQLKKIKLNVNAGLNANGGKINNYINGDKNTNTYYTLGANFGLWHEKEKKYSINFESRPAFTNSKSTLNTAIVTKYWTVDNEIGTTIQLPKKFEFNTNLNYNWRQKTDVFGEDRNVWLWNSWLAKKIWKNDAGEIRFTINDILNQNVGFQRNASSNFISERTYSTLRRYWLISFTWNFSKSPGAK